MFWIAVLVVITILVIYACVIRKSTKQYIIRGMVVNILSDTDNKDEAIAIMVECNTRMLRLFEHLRKKFKIGITDSECPAKCQNWVSQHQNEREVIIHLLRGFNYEKIYEHKASVTNVAYSLNKGEHIMLCLRENNAKRRVVDINDLLFVTIHEAAHIANYNEWGHGQRFWAIFKYLLQEAAAIGIYKPIDYSVTPHSYCGFIINHNPLVDPRILVWEGAKMFS